MKSNFTQHSQHKIFHKLFSFWIPKLARYKTFKIGPYCLFIYLFGVLRCFQHCTGHITTGSWKGRGNQYIQFIRILYCKLPTNGKQLPAFPLQAVTGIEPRPQRWEARVLPLCHRGPSLLSDFDAGVKCEIWIDKIFVVYFFIFGFIC